MLAIPSRLSRKSDALRLRPGEAEDDVLGRQRLAAVEGHPRPQLEPPGRGRGEAPADGERGLDAHVRVDVDQGLEDLEQDRLGLLVGEGVRVKARGLEDGGPAHDVSRPGQVQPLTPMGKAQTITRTDLMAASLAWFARQDDPGRERRNCHARPIHCPLPCRASRPIMARSRSGSGTMRVRAVLLAAALALAPLGTQAETVVRWATPEPAADLGPARRGRVLHP